MKNVVAAIFIGFLFYTFYSIYREEAPVEKKKLVTKVEMAPKEEEVKPVTKMAKKKKKVKKKLVPQKRGKLNKIDHLSKIEKKDDTFVELDAKGNMLVTSVFVDGKYVVYQGDILITDKKTFYKLGMDKKPLTIGKPKLWPNGEVPYVIEPGLPNKKEVNEAIAFINKNTDVKFMPRKKEKGYVEFKKGENNCYANLGYKEKKRQVILEPDCKKREILHELMHILGFYHEQCREDRDLYLIVVWDNIDEKFHMQFKKIPMSLMNVKGGRFDFDSIMLYGPKFFSLYEGEYTMTTISGDIYKGNSSGELSRADILKINDVY